MLVGQQGMKGVLYSHWLWAVIIDFNCKEVPVNPIIQSRTRYYSSPKHLIRHIMLGNGQPMLRRNISVPSSGMKRKSSEKPTYCRQQAEPRSSEMTVAFHSATQRYAPRDRTLLVHRIYALSKIFSYSGEMKGLGQSKSLCRFPFHCDRAFL
jgi:hypothetical protein